MQALAMAQELLRYHPTEGNREGWLAQIAELEAITNEEPALGSPRVRERQICRQGLVPRGAGNGKSAPAKRADFRAAASPHDDLTCHIVQRALEDASISLECCQENHDLAIDDIGEAGKNAKDIGELVYNPRCLTLAHQQRYVVWPDKFRPDIGARYADLPTP
jgi:hypothetical protein